MLAVDAAAVAAQPFHIVDGAESLCTHSLKRDGGAVQRAKNIGLHYGAYIVTGKVEEQYDVITLTAQEVELAEEVQD